MADRPGRKYHRPRCAPAVAGNKRCFMKALLTTLVVLIGTGLASANVTVTGTGKVTYTPDLFHVSVGVSSDGKTATEAWQKNEAIIKKLMETLKQFGIEAKDIK